MIPIELIIAGGCIASGTIGFFAAALLASHRDSKAYRAGRRDMEKLIRDRAVVDLRDSGSFSR